MFGFDRQARASCASGKAKETLMGIVIDEG